MKKLKTYTGGHEISADDLDHVQASVVETLSMLFKGLVSNGASIPNCILYGVVFTVAGDDVSWTAGALVLDGEPCAIAAGTYNITSLPVGHYGKFVKSDTYSALDPVLYYDGSTKNVYCNTIAVFTTGLTVGTAELGVIGAGIPARFTELLKGNIFGSSTAWNYPGNPTFPAFLNSFTSTGIGIGSTVEKLRWFKDVGGLVKIEGLLNLVGISTAASFAAIASTPLAIVQLQSIFYPDKNHANPSVRIQTQDGWCTVWIEVRTDGKLYVVRVSDVDAGVTPSSFAADDYLANLNLLYRAV